MSSLTSFSGAVPANYDKYLGPFLFEPYALDLIDRLKTIKFTNVLELACGTGRLTRHLAKLIPRGGRFIASDLNADMVEFARRVIPDSNIDWQIIDAQQLPFEDDSFDLVICQYGVMFFPDKLKAYSEAYRVLRSGGGFIFNVWDSMEFNPSTNVIEQVLQETFRDKAPDFFSKGPYSYFDEEVINKSLKEAGFKEIQIELVMKQNNYGRAEDLLKGFFEGSPLGSYLDNYDPDVKEELLQKIKQRLDDQFGKDGVEVPLQALVCLGLK
jgi:ubiquinone/menaquinone biosynthesis C-methylase UbiE